MSLVERASPALARGTVEQVPLQDSTAQTYTANDVDLILRTQIDC